MTVSKVTEGSVESVESKAEDLYGVFLDLFEKDTYLQLDRIRVIDKNERRKGLGTKVMQLVIAYADEVGKPIYLTPSTDFGASSVSRLVDFYKRFDFKKKDRSDYTTKDIMVREPRIKESKKSLYREVLEEYINTPHKPDVKGEMDEIQRVVQDIDRIDGVITDVESVIKAFNKSEEETLTDEMWEKLEHTESNTIEKGDWDKVNDIASRFNKTSPEKLKKAITSDEYNRPLIIQFGERYRLVAGNTRLCTAAAMGISPKVFIARIDID